jgi:hypothetical protein
LYTPPVTSPEFSVPEAVRATARSKTSKVC